MDAPTNSTPEGGRQEDNNAPNQEREATYLPHLKKSLEVLTYTYIVAGYFCDSSSALLFLRVISQFLFLGPRSMVAALRPPSYFGMLRYIIFVNLYAIIVSHWLLHDSQPSQLFVPSWTVAGPVMGVSSLLQWLRGGTTSIAPSPVLPAIDETSRLMNHIYPGGVPGVKQGVMVEYINPATRNHGGLLSFEFTGNVLESSGRLVLNDMIIFFLQLALFALNIMPHYKPMETPQRLGAPTSQDESDESITSEDPLLSGQVDGTTPRSPREQMIEDRISGQSVAGEIAIWPAISNVISQRNVNRYEADDQEAEETHALHDVVGGTPFRFMTFQDLEQQQQQPPQAPGQPAVQNTTEDGASWLSGVRNWARSVGSGQQTGQRLGTQQNEN